MNINQIKTKIRQAYDTGTRHGVLYERGQQPSRGPNLREEFIATLREIEAKELDWHEAERIANVDDVDEAIRDLLEDGTADGGVILVQRVIAAYLKG